MTGAHFTAAMRRIYQDVADKLGATYEDARAIVLRMSLEVPADERQRKRLEELGGITFAEPQDDGPDVP